MTRRGKILRAVVVAIVVTLVSAFIIAMGIKAARLPKPPPRGDDTASCLQADSGEWYCTKGDGKLYREANKSVKH